MAKNSPPKNHALAEMLLLSDATAAAWLDISRATFWRRVSDGTFPQPVRIAGCTRWRADELRALIDAETDRQRGTKDV